MFVFDCAESCFSLFLQPLFYIIIYPPFSLREDKYGYILFPLLFIPIHIFTRRSFLSSSQHALSLYPSALSPCETRGYPLSLTLSFRCFPTALWLTISNHLSHLCPETARFPHGGPIPTFLDCLLSQL